MSRDLPLAGLRLTYRELAQMLWALGVNSRLEILCIIAANPGMHVGAITEHIGIERTKLSLRVQPLLHTGLVQRKQEWTWPLRSVNNERLTTLRDSLRISQLAQLGPLGSRVKRRRLPL